ncbi:hypothetical protein CON68_21770 [Bacillus toyonensis]|nr:hypothetical protein F8507_22615 [Bacillus toyonensis]PDZ32112.1 hypothetical protein CON68_21770 [Bacillus toyonensis]PEI50364.1 hypothetical protein CN631_14960 [Bacillus toyonensis]PEJ12333.1 hypothetical protein CN682_23390 [Bacillus toyonensis]PEM61093.1 hypothetical protein CN625_16150 [Bacillus toyonensis]
MIRINILFLEGETRFDYSKCMNRMIFCIDLCSFFASCACVNVNLYKCPRVHMCKYGRYFLKRAIV